MSDRDTFNSTWPMIREELMSFVREYSLGDEVNTHILNMFEHSIPGGKMNRALFVIETVKILKGRALTESEYEEASVLGWCVEILQAFFLVADDVMDQSITRRGQPCWYRMPGIGLDAINDSFILENVIYALIKKHFAGKPYYVDLLEIFLKISFRTELGQLMDLTSTPKDMQLDLSRFTEERHTNIVVYKTAFYSFYLPVCIGILCAEVKLAKAGWDIVEKMCIEIGKFFQIQDDYLDCYGDPETIGKIGTDIEDAKCSWMVVKALQLCSPEDRKMLDACYGKKDSENVKKVKELYGKLDLSKVYHEYEDASHAELMEMMKGIEGFPVEVFMYLIKKIYHRTK
uniref:Farnesyl pyrophosphate synthase 2 n=1 Tax=Stygiella incarcerata TaxID=1712417 RepID=A0A192ZHW1_9EUKA|nr:farnesyl pyrophosphate synthase 2 [Stygiella incarcerata]|eukprot:TRINITY_DN837_c0_g1_i1.p1 TRINITY_DN837_c0_g1~~TRINITY_DN837_c0_g1_i1.p1  ORF type:complete len:344 (-),score=87.69 TRINITY_DN837_c0_g1_i1:118-1149(-)